MRSACWTFLIANVASGAENQTSAVTSPVRPTKRRQCPIAGKRRCWVVVQLRTVGPVVTSGGKAKRSEGREPSTVQKQQSRTDVEARVATSPLAVKSLLGLQRTAGNRAVTSVLARQGSVGDARVQRVGTHFQTFLKQKDPGSVPATTPASKERAISAWLLDQNVYEIAQFLGGEVSEPVFAHMEKLPSLGVTLEEVRAFLIGLNAPGPQNSPEERVAWLSQFIANIPKNLTTAISGQTGAGGQATSILDWRGLTPWGAGTGATLLMRPGGVLKGSGAGGDPVWMKQIEQHIADGGGSTIWVRGHLINYDIGGPGLDYNMVPLTGKKSKTAGGNDANGEHFNAVENRAKQIMGDVLSGAATEGRYVVTPEYNRTARAATGQVRAEATKLGQILSQEHKNRSAALMVQGPAAVSGRYNTAFTSLGAPVPVPLPDTQGQADQLAMIDLNQVGRETLAALRTAGNPIAATIDAQIDRGILQASVSGQDPDGFSLHDLFGALQGNAETWEAEDRYAPTSLKVELQWILPTALGVVQGPAINPIPVTPPTDPKKVWFRPKKNSEVA